MKKSSLIIFAFALLFCVKHASAQDYKTAVGLHFSYEVGPSIKYFYEDDTALEGIVGFRSHGVVFSGLWGKHVPVFDVDKLKFFYGFGAHIGGVGAGTYRRFGTDDINYQNNTILLGADGIIGLEYKIPTAPIAINLDLMPRLELAHGPYFDISPGLGVKYTF